MTQKNTVTNKTTNSNLLNKINVVVESDNNKPEVKKTKHDSVPQITKPQELGGRGGLEPTRYGDWEKNGRCIDF